MIRVVSSREMRDIDRISIEERSLSCLALMEHAGEVVRKVIRIQPHARFICVVVGKGNNAGDGLVVARLLAEDEKEVEVICLSSQNSLTTEGNENLLRLPKSVKILAYENEDEIERTFQRADLIVDAILGTGIRGPIRGVFGEAIAKINGLGKTVIAIDIPSGLDADTGQAEGPCIRATETVTMGLPKIGLLMNEGVEMAGNIHIADIGFPQDLLDNSHGKTHLLELTDAGNGLPGRARNGHKGTFGSLLVVAGSCGMEGAAFLTSTAALRSGVGLVYGAFPDRVATSLSGRLIEAVKIPLPAGKGTHLTQDAWDTLEPYLVRVNAIALGPGIGTHEDTARLVDELVCQDTPIVIDADGLNCLGQKVLYLTKRKEATILTPHPGEMGRLLGIETSEVQKDRLGTAGRLAREAKAIVVLKGAQTVIAHPDGRLFLNPASNTGLAKGGSGDVLTGLIGGLLAQGCPALEAAYAGVYLHGVAGSMARKEIGVRGMTAGDVLERIPAALAMAEEAVGISERETQITRVSWK